VADPVQANVSATSPAQAQPGGAPMESQQAGYCPVCGPADLGHNKACPYGKRSATGPTATQDRQDSVEGVTRLYLALADAMGYETGKGGLEWSAEEWAAELKRKADAYDAAGDESWLEARQRDVRTPDGWGLWSRCTDAHAAAVRGLTHWQVRLVGVLSAGASEGEPQQGRATQ
jgi:hypothetical protein